MRTTNVRSAAAALQAGHLCAIPTETVYGLAADANNSIAIGRVFEAKGRPTDHPLIVHIASVDFLDEWILDLPAWAHTLSATLWPGPLTIVGKRTDRATHQVTGGQNTVAVRVPRHPLTLELLNALHSEGITGLVAPSANRFGHVSPTTPDHVARDLGAYLDAHDDLILDGGPCTVGVESTIVLAIDSVPKILRPGAITAADIEQITGLTVSESDHESPRVSGALDSHYTPVATVVLIEHHDVAALSAHERSGLIAESSVATPDGVERLLSPRTNDEFAHDLYAALRRADELELTHVFVVSPHGDDVAVAINDRLRRAAF